MNNLFNENFLTDSKCAELKDQIRKDFFSRLDKASMRHFQPNIIKDVDINLKGKLGAPILNPQEKAKKISERIRNYNRSHMKKKQKLSCSKDHSEDKIREGIEDQIAQVNKKADLPKIEKRQLFDPNAPKYETKYIDEVENQFIKPYLKNNGMFYIDYIENKKSKIPLNFCIGK